MSRASVSAAVPDAQRVSVTTRSAIGVPLPTAVGGCPQFLLASVRRAVRAGGDWQQVADRVAGVLRNQLPGPAILTPGQLRGDPAGYQTHLLHAEPDGSFSVTVMVWLPGQRTSIHDHLAWCVTAVLQGTESEEIFALEPAAGQGSALRVIARNENQAGAVAGFAPPGDIHRVTNSGAGTAVSMHIYGTDLTRVGSSIRREYAFLG